MRPFRVLALMGIYLLGLAGSAGADVIYVKAGATGAQNGLSWANAYADLQAALATAQSGDEVWVAAGTYKPTMDTLRTKSFVMPAGVALYGGFAGGETARGQRDHAAHATILSGDIGAQGSATDNSYHVVVGANDAVLDGFTISGGTGVGTTSHGAGMINDGVSPTIAHCTFSNNTTDSDGAGIYNTNKAAPTLNNCAFTSNTTRNGNGGGMANVGNASPMLIHCTFIGNTAGSRAGDYSIYGRGGGMWNDNASPIVTGCMFSGNAVGGDGGGMFNANSASPTVTNCTFTLNKAGEQGGGMSNTNALPTVTNCTFTDNTARWSGGGIIISNGSPTITNCTFSNNTACYGGGITNGSGSPTVTNCTFTNNTATGSSHYPDNPYAGGGFFNGGGSPTLTNCIFWGDNNAIEITNWHYPLDGHAALIHCDIQGSGSGAWNPELGTDGGGNIMADPLFVDAAHPAGRDNRWHTSDDGLALSAGSPCINAGNPAAAPKQDIFGRQRDAMPDIGAYEWVPKTGVAVWSIYP